MTTAIRPIYATTRAPTVKKHSDRTENWMRAYKLYIRKEDTRGTDRLRAGRGEGALEHAQLRAPGAAISEDFCARGDEGLLRRERPEPLVDGVAQHVLHDAIFDAVEGDDREPTARRECAKRGSEPFAERTDLVVRRDAERLEGLGRGVSLPFLIPMRRTRLDGRDERAGREDARLRARRDDRARDRTRELLFAVGEEDVGDLFFARTVDDIGGRLPVLAIGHKKRLILPEGEAARRGYLVSAPPEVEEDRVGTSDAEPFEDAREVAEIVIHQRRGGALGSAVARVRFARALNCGGVGVNADDDAAFSERREKLFKMP